MLSKQLATASKANHRFLIIEDEEYFRGSLVKMLSPYAQIIDVSTKEAAIKELNRNYFDAVIIDIDLHGTPAGFDILKAAKALNRYTIMLTDHNSDEYIKRAYAIGCNHYLLKDQTEHVLDLIIRERLSSAADTISQEFFKKEYVTCNQDLINEITSLKKRLSSDRSLLLLGPTGVGKTKLAEHIHAILGGSKSNFVSLNVASIPSELVESELFGYQKGAFTGALKDKKGLIEMASDGTLFLDEITSMPASLQKKLLKCLEEKSFYPLGASKPKQIKFRLITSTCENIYEQIETGNFRSDLFFRIAGITVVIPALRDRSHDIIPLIKHFLTKGTRQISIDQAAQDLLTRYCWPGNIRELRSLVEDLAQKADGTITPADLPRHICMNVPPINPSDNDKFISNTHMKFIEDHGYPLFIRKIEAEVGVAFRKKFGVNADEGAAFAKISRAYFYRIMQWGKDVGQYVFKEGQNNQSAEEVGLLGMKRKTRYVKKNSDANKKEQALRH